MIVILLLAIFIEYQQYFIADEQEEIVLFPYKCYLLARSYVKPNNYIGYISDLSDTIYLAVNPMRTNNGLVSHRLT